VQENQMRYVVQPSQNASALYDVIDIVDNAPIFGGCEIRKSYAVQMAETLNRRYVEWCASKNKNI
jgi:hypothetical protein